MDLDEGLSSHVEEFAREMDNSKGGPGAPAGSGAECDSDGDFDDFDDADEPSPVPPKVAAVVAPPKAGVSGTKAK
jgi:hypothetical protein